MPYASPDAQLQEKARQFRQAAPGLSTRFGSANQFANAYASNPLGISFQELQGMYSPRQSGNTLGATTGPDPQAAQRAAFSQQFRARQGQVRSGSSQAFRGLGDSFESGARGLVNKLRSGQRNINMDRQSTVLNRMRSINDLVRNIRQGVQSGGIKLAASNVLPGSAYEGLAQDYGRFGTQERGGIMNQAALGLRDIGVRQDEMDIMEAEEIRKLRTVKNTETARISQSVVNQLEELNAIAAEQGIGERADVQLERQNIVNAGIARLSQLDKWLSTQVQSIRPQSREAVEAEAYRLNQAGSAPGTFDFEQPEIGLPGAPPPGGLPVAVRAPDEEELVV